jgi:hypothetical protein
MAITIQLRRDTEQNWTTNNPVLASGEIAFSTDQYNIKIGDGVSNWSSLEYLTANNSSITIDNKANIDTSTTTVSTTNATTINITSGSVYRSAEYLVQVTQGSKQTLSKIVMIHDGTTANISEYAVIELGGTRIPLTISATISGTDILLQATITDANTTNATIEVVRTAIVL